MKKLWLGAFLALSLLLSANNVFAQQISGINGVVTDKSGGTLAGVTVVLENEATGLHLEATTSDQGFYQFLRVNPAEDYQISFSLNGFEKLVVFNIALGVSTTESRNVTLQIGNVSQTVEVAAAGEGTLNTTDATIGNVITSREVTELPIQTRLNPAALMQLQAGVNDSGSITGARTDQGNITLDGIDVNDQETGQAFSSTTPISVDSVQEIRTITAGETADFGRSSGGAINLETKGGTNNFHGNIREYNRNTLFEANDWFNNRDGIARAPLVRNQFGGSIGGPVKRDKIFFFFDYEALRTAASSTNVRAVPTQQFRNGMLAYVNSTIDPATGNPCDGTARLNTAPTCISFLSPTQVSMLDPQGVGANAAFLSFVNSRYPLPNDPTGGDGINSEGFRFTSPARTSDNLYTTRIDWSLSQKNKIFFRGNVAREGVDDDFNTSIVQFPGDPVVPVERDKFNSYTIIAGWTWTINSTHINQLTAGFVRPILEFNSQYQPTFPNEISFSGGITNPYLGYSSQSRNVPVPEIRDNFTLTKGKHTIDFGGDVKLTRVISGLTNSYNFVGYGLGGQIQTLDNAGGPSLRPSDISSDTSAISNYDGYFPLLLGRYSSISTNFNYDKSQNALPAGSDKARYYNYNEFELYAQDSWKVRSDLTMTYGLRWDYHSVPYEINGFQATPSINENAYLADRIAAGQAGLSGDTAIPFVSYSLGGPANNAAGFYKPDHKDFGPRIGVAYNPAFRNGVLNGLFGDRKSTIRLGGAILYDRIAGGASFGLDQNTFLFDSNNTSSCGIAGDPYNSLLTDPRFTAIGATPPATATCSAPTAPIITNPSTPNVQNGVPFGTVNGGFPSFFQFDHNTKNPYSILMNLGVQRELPGDFLLEVNYVARLGRRLLGVGDAGQIVNFKDPASGQFLKAAFGQLETQVQAGVPFNQINNVAWFENQMGGTAGCQNYSSSNFGISLSCSQLAAGFFGQLIGKGDLSDTVQQLTASGFLNSNVGLPAQTSANAYVGNYGSSNYNALLLSVRKRVSNNLQFDFNYTFSHSIDNFSDVTNNYVTYTGAGSQVICDLTDLRACRASSDFDARHVISGNYIFDLPVGQGKTLLHDAPKWLDTAVGGWTWSGIVVYRTGFPFSVSTGAFPTDYTLDSPAVVTGPSSSLKGGIHTDSNGNLQYFANTTNALNALGFPQAGNVGNRNAVRGPGFFNVDMGVSKAFKMPWSDRQQLKLRGDAFNVFNHPSFNAPGATLSNTSSFGLINTTASTPRVLQVALRFEF